MKKLDKILDLTKSGVLEFKSAKRIRFQDVVKSNWQPKKGVLEFPGVYAIYEKNKGLIYIGSAGKGGHHIRYRVANLFSYNPKIKKSAFKHSLTKKLLWQIKRFKTIDGVRRFYFKKCYIKVVETKEIRHARILEDTLIYLYNPKYNQE